MIDKIPLKLQPILVASVAVIIYCNSLGGELVFDDIAAIQDNRDVRPHNPLYNLFVNDFWGTPIHKEQSHKSYRPLCVLSFRLNYAVHGVKPFGYHVVNVFLHALVCVLYFRYVGLRLLTSQRPTYETVVKEMSSKHLRHSFKITCDVKPEINYFKNKCTGYVKSKFVTSLQKLGEE
ncbi:protein O-mannosyl-transferase Tmtc3-like [Tachypleus tridentatus]|uniref:protein O-mannosyl-transferase Tmtc3-like n=1 Tax=Tachypleus tridentatus TaxID=6853 RepID=UPI003FD519FE